MPDIALYQPDIPQNTGTILRMAACLGLSVHLIEPAGFALSDRNLRRAGLDYLDQAAMQRHLDWAAFESWRKAEGRRLLLLTTAAATAYTDFAFESSDILLMGRESAGAPPEVHEAADARLIIPMRPPARSLNIALAAAMVTGEALRQTAQFP
ncbi:tRNA (cytidine(34)-2'-O)-methyltransferase [Breoghania sp.]|uniref:tRNA (cytidine(34)-2'-O)-methyltransferase n=1 Tax=Breoghania sp. TaxID=2065378 RepID=UPI0029CA9272|nr:tRNA (cytidine(34)-2'-O)-methyltransferase [Breoghania sp.]